MFREILIDLLAEYDLTQADFAMQADIPKTTISGWIREGRKPDYIALQKLSKFFNVTSDYLLELESKDIYKSISTAKAAQKKEEKEILKYFDAMTKEQKAETRGFMQGILATSDAKTKSLNKSAKGSTDSKKN